MEKIKLNQDAGSMPLYSQIKQIILNDIKNGVYRLNETIPTEKQLQEIFGVSRMTIRLAIDALVAEGYVVKERSKGTRVIYPKITESLNEVTNFSQEMRNKGIQYNIHSVEVTIVKAGEDIANALQIEEGVNVLRLHRVYYVNQEPLCSITSYLPAALNLSVDLLYMNILNVKKVFVSQACMRILRLAMHMLLSVVNCRSQSTRHCY